MAVAAVEFAVFLKLSKVFSDRDGRNFEKAGKFADLYALVACQAVEDHRVAFVLGHCVIVLFVIVLFVIYFFSQIYETNCYIRNRKFRFLYETTQKAAPKPSALLF